MNGGINTIDELQDFLAKTRTNIHQGTYKMNYDINSSEKYSDHEIDNVFANTIDKPRKYAKRVQKFFPTDPTADEKDNLENLSNITDIRIKDEIIKRRLNNPQSIISDAENIAEVLFEDIARNAKYIGRHESENIKEDIKKEVSKIISSDGENEEKKAKLETFFSRKNIDMTKKLDEARKRKGKSKKGESLTDVHSEQMLNIGAVIHASIETATKIQERNKRVGDMFYYEQEEGVNKKLKTLNTTIESIYEDYESEMTEEGKKEFHHDMVDLASRRLTAIDKKEKSSRIETYNYGKYFSNENSKKAENLRAVVSTGKFGKIVDEIEDFCDYMNKKDMMLKGVTIMSEKVFSSADFAPQDLCTKFTHKELENDKEAFLEKKKELAQELEKRIDIVKDSEELKGYDKEGIKTALLESYKKHVISSDTIEGGMLYEIIKNDENKKYAESRASIAVAEAARDLAYAELSIMNGEVTEFDVEENLRNDEYGISEKLEREICGSHNMNLIYRKTLNGEISHENARKIIEENPEILKGGSGEAAFLKTLKYMDENNTLARDNSKIFEKDYEEGEKAKKEVGYEVSSYYKEKLVIDRILKESARTTGADKLAYLFGNKAALQELSTCSQKAPQRGTDSTASIVSGCIEKFEQNLDKSVSETSSALASMSQNPLSSFSGMSLLLAISLIMEKGAKENFAITKFRAELASLKAVTHLEKIEDPEERQVLKAIYSAETIPEGITNFTVAPGQSEKLEKELLRQSFIKAGEKKITTGNGSKKKLKNLNARLDNLGHVCKGLIEGGLETKDYEALIEEIKNKPIVVSSKDIPLEELLVNTEEVKELKKQFEKNAEGISKTNSRIQELLRNKKSTQLNEDDITKFENEISLSKISEKDKEEALSGAREIKASLLNYKNEVEKLKEDARKTADIINEKGIEAESEEIYSKLAEKEKEIDSEFQKLSISTNNAKLNIQDKIKEILKAIEKNPESSKERKKELKTKIEDAKEELLDLRGSVSRLKDASEKIKEYLEGSGKEEEINLVKNGAINPESIEKILDSKNPEALAVYLNSLESLERENFSVEDYEENIGRKDSTKRSVKKVIELKESNDAKRELLKSLSHISINKTLKDDDRSEYLEETSFDELMDEIVLENPEIGSREELFDSMKEYGMMSQRGEEGETDEVRITSIENKEYVQIKEKAKMELSGDMKEKVKSYKESIGIADDVVNKKAEELKNREDVEKLVSKMVDKNDIREVGYRELVDKIVADISKIGLEDGDDNKLDNPIAQKLISSLAENKKKRNEEKKSEKEEDTKSKLKEVFGSLDASFDDEKKKKKEKEEEYLQAPGQ